MTVPRNPDIQRLLANLRGTQLAAGESPQVYHDNNAGTPSSQQQHAIYSNTSIIPGLGLLPTQEGEREPMKTPVQVPKPVEPKSAPQVDSRPTTPIVPDASTITTWPAALKHVTKYIIPNEPAANKIKYLIQQQHKHERQWWAGREAIVNRQSGRPGNQAKVADLLKSLGGAAVPVSVHNPEKDQAELEAYDRKVYKSLTDMVADFDRQLRSLQVPFFAIKHDLMISSGGTRKPGVNTTVGKLDTGELRELQRRMVETLEDLLGDD